MKKNEKKFQVVKTFLKLIAGRVKERVKGLNELLGLSGLRIYPQNDQKMAKSQAPPMGNSAE